MNREEMLKKVQMLSFVVKDVQLYLDTLPNDEAALNFFAKYNELSQQAQMEFTAAYGPLRISDVDIKDHWSWIEKPWPWELEA